MDSNWTGDDRPHTLHGLFSGTWMVRTRDQTIRTTRSGSSVFLLPLFGERFRRSGGPSLVPATGNTIYSTPAACTVTTILPSAVPPPAPPAPPRCHPIRAAGITTAEVPVQKPSRRALDADAAKSSDIVGGRSVACMWSVWGSWGSEAGRRWRERRERTAARVAPGRTVPSSGGVTTSSAAG